MWPGPKEQMSVKKNVCLDQGHMPMGHCKVLVKNYLLYAPFKVTKLSDISSGECFVIKRRRRCKITAKGGDWEECGSLLWTCLGGIAVCGQRQCAFVPDQS